MQSWSVRVSLCCFVFFFLPKIQSQQYGLVYQSGFHFLFAILFVSHGQQISRKQSGNPEKAERGESID